MKKKSSNKEPIKINELIENFYKKYNTLITFVSLIEIEMMFKQAISELPEIEDFNPEFHIDFLVEKIFFLKARDEINNGNIDLEILIIDKYLSLAKFLLSKLDYKENDADSVAEEGIINGIENYNGQDTFKISILKSLKEIVSKKKKNSLSKEVIEEEKEQIPQRVDNTVLEIVADDLQDKLEEKVKEQAIEKNSNCEHPKKELVIPNDNIIRMPNQLELLIRSIDILQQIPTDDEMYLKFVSLKYGYHKNQYFSLDEIANILNISLDDSKKYYFQSLEYVKNWFGLQLDKMYTYYIRKSE